jgi:hypothetical protein
MDITIANLPIVDWILNSALTYIIIFTNNILFIFVITYFLKKIMQSLSGTTSLLHHPGDATTLAMHWTYRPSIKPMHHA